MRTGVRVAVDVGSVRVGVAASDPSGTLASPVTVLRRDARSDRDVAELAALVREREAIEVVVGMPRTLRNAEGAAAALARGYALSLAAAVAPVPVRLVDERLTTVEAARGLRAAGHDAKSARGVVDAAAAVVLLQSALDTERRTDAPAGEIVSVEDPP
ncbi:MAG TPA: Holliday junction resolvase RuvX [Mycobacteriales bacterium]|jgi:putative Holliday junction resolvase|nr:Holliday junction resolvase RuvX [Mycobacteriales bacterium]